MTSQIQFLRKQTRSKVVTKPKKSEPEIERVDSGLDASNLKGKFEAMKIKDFKINGVIGNPGCKDRITYSSLVYQIENARKMKYSDAEISAGIIKNMQADLELKTLFELEPSISLNTMLDMLRSCYTEPDSATLYSEFTSAAQLPTESAQRFVTRLMVLAKKVMTLSIEEGCAFDERMMQKRFFHVMFTGLREENIRSQLRMKCKNDHTLPREEILKYIADISTVEMERKEKLFPKKETSVNMVGLEGNRCDGNKKTKENPFTKIDDLKAEMRAEMQKEKEELKAELFEIKKVILSSYQNQNPQKNNFQDAHVQNQQFRSSSMQDQKFQNSNWQSQNLLNPSVQNAVPQNRNNSSQLNPMQPPFIQGTGRGGQITKCAGCISRNAPRCFHCWHCGSTTHRRFECPNFAEMSSQEKNE